MKILFAILLLLTALSVHELGHFAAAKLMGIGVHELSIGVGKPLLSHNMGGTLYCLRAVPVAAFVKVAVQPGDCQKGETPLSEAGVLKKVLLYLAGPLANFSLVYVAVGLLLLVGYTMPAAVFGSVVPGSVLDRAGLRSGDQAVSVNGRPVYTSAEFNVAMGYGAGSHAVALSDGRTVVVPAVPGVNIKTAWVPAAGRVIRSSRSLPEIMGIATFTLKRLAWQNYTGLKAVVLGGQTKDLSGPIGQVQVVSGLLRCDLYTPMMLLAVISVALGCLNLIPLPITDGGQTVLAFVEATAGGLPVWARNVWNAVGVASLVLLMVWSTLADLWRLLPGK